MKTCEALRSEGFHSVTTIEFRLRTINHAEVRLEVPDFGSAPAPASAASATVESGHVFSGEGSAAGDVIVDKGRGGVKVTKELSATGKAGAEKSDVAQGDSPARISEAPIQEMASNRAIGGGGNGNTSSKNAPDQTTDREHEPSASGVVAGNSHQDSAGGANKRQRESVQEGEEDGENIVAVVTPAGAETKANGDGRGRESNDHGRTGRDGAGSFRGPETKPLTSLVCASPYPTMRGHTAFLTFATTPVSRRPVVEAASGAAGEEGKATDVDCHDGTVGIDAASQVNRKNDDEMDIVCGAGGHGQGKKSADGVQGGVESPANDSDGSKIVSSDTVAGR